MKVVLIWKGVWEIVASRYAEPQDWSILSVKTKKKRKEEKKIPKLFSTFREQWIQVFIQELQVARHQRMHGQLYKFHIEGYIR